MGEFPVYTKDVQGPGDIFKLCGKFGCSRTMKIAKGKNNLGMFSKKSRPTSATIESEISNPSFKIIISGGILNYVSHVMFNAVNYLTTQRPLNFTLYCRHDLQVDLFKPSWQLNSWC